MKRKSPQNMRRAKRQLAKAMQQELYDDAIIIYHLVHPKRSKTSNEKV